MNPSNITITYLDPGSDAYLYTTCEHYTDLESSDDGTLTNKLNGLFFI